MGVIGHGAWPRTVGPTTPRNHAATVHHFRLTRRDGQRCVDDTVALLVVARALVESYPTWTDENGTNVDQLAAIAVGALAEHGLLVDTEAQPVRTART
jgi:hypothetical protein